MDRLAEIPRSTPTPRSDANDFTRQKSTRNERAERRDDVEARSDDKVRERERPERSTEKPERFAAHLEEQKATLEPQNALPAAPETDAQESSEAEPASGEAPVEAKTENVPSPKPTPVVPKGGPELALEPAQPEITASVAAETKPEPKPIATPAVPSSALPTTAPIQAFAPAQPNDTKATAIEASATSSPRIEGETRALEAELAAPQSGPVRNETPVNQTQNAQTRADKPVEAAPAEAPRESPAARSAHEVERAAEILRQVRVQITPQMSEARIQLHPVELGRISIHLSLEEGRVKTTVHAEKQETLQAIQTHLPELRASLRQHGIDAQEFQLSLGFENNGGRDADKAQRRSNPRSEAAESAVIERSPALHAALAKTGVDFYA